MNSSSSFFCLFLLIAVIAAISLSQVVLSLTDDQEKVLDTDLSFYKTFLNNSINTATVQLNSSVTACSVGGVACNPPTTIPFINFSNYIPLNYAYVQIKEFTGQQYTNMQQQTCALTGMRNQWLQNYNASSNKLLYQYFTYPDSFFGVFPASNFNCSTLYEPTVRPFYVSSSTGQKNMIILIDASSTAGFFTLNVAKKVAKQIVRSLSYRDFASVIAYGDSPDQSTSINVQGTNENIQLLLSQIDQIEMMPNNGTNIAAAIDFAHTVFKISESLSLTSRCTDVIVLLSGGDNTNPSPQPGVTIGAHPSTILFPLLVTNNVTTAKVNLFKGLACGSRSVTANITADTESEILKWTVIIQYFSKLLSSSVMRFSEVYEDALGQGTILSLSAPLFNVEGLAGVVTLDAPIAAFNQNGNLTSSDINDYNLANQVCSALDHRSDSQTENVESVQNGLCNSETSDDLAKIGFRTSGGGEELAINEAMPGVTAASVLFIVFLSAFMVFASYKKGKTTSVVGMIAFIVCWLICLPIMFELVAPDLVQVNNFVKTELTISSTTAQQYRCCQIGGCSDCSNAPYGTASCSAEIARRTKETNGTDGSTVCSAGYKCCRRVSYSCNCRQVRRCTSSSSGSGKKKSTKRTCSYRTECDTCYRCVESVSRRSCTVICGSCYAMTSKFFYEYKPKDSDVPVTYLSQWTKTCSLAGAAECRGAWKADYPVGSKRDGFVNPENPVDVRQNVELRQGPFIAFMFFAVLSIPILIFACYNTFQDKCKGGDSSKSSSYVAFKGAPTEFTNTQLASTITSPPAPMMQPPPPSQPPQPEFGAGDNVAPPTGGYDFGVPQQQFTTPPVNNTDYGVPQPPMVSSPPPPTGAYGDNNYNNTIQGF